MNLEQYINALKWHDWSFEHSDDASVVSHARKTQQEITLAQPRLDPDFRLWNQYAPRDFKKGTK